MDVIANMLSKIKNASMARIAEVEVMHTNECESICKALKKLGYIEEVKVFKEKFKGINIKLSYDSFNTPKIEELKRVSKPGRRIYKGYEDIAYVAGGLGDYVVSTSMGILVGKEARRRKLGGEIICLVR